MKHGISPTTPRGQKHERVLHVSVPLALQCTDNRPDEQRNDQLCAEAMHLDCSMPDKLRILADMIDASRVRVIPTNEAPKGYEFVKLVRAPMKGRTFRTVK